MFAMVAKRLVAPCSTRHLAEWVEMDVEQTLMGLSEFGVGVGSADVGDA